MNATASACSVYEIPGLGQVALSRLLELHPTPPHTTHQPPPPPQSNKFIIIIIAVRGGFLSLFCIRKENFY